MTKSPKLVLKNRRVLHTYSELWRAANLFFRRSKREEAGRYWFWMASLVFAAFALEAYLNHVGSKVLGSWSSINMRSPLAKLEVIASELDVTFPQDVRPGQTIRDLFRFRNDIAHGKTLPLVAETPVPDYFLSLDRQEIELFLSKVSPATIDGPSHWWEQFCSEANAEHVLVDVLTVMRDLQAKANIDGDVLFDSGEARRTVLGEGEI